MANPNSATRNKAGLVQELEDKLSGATVKVRLFNGQALDGDSVIGDLSTGEVSGNGYTASGYTLTMGTAAWDATDNRAESAATQLDLTPSGGNWTFDQLVVTINNGTDAIHSVYGFPSTQTYNDGLTYPINVKLTSGAQGATVDLTDS
jgi:hypothetical protein